MRGDAGVCKTLSSGECTGLQVAKRSVDPDVSTERILRRQLKSFRKKLGRDPLPPAAISTLIRADCQESSRAARNVSRKARLCARCEYALIIERGCRL